MKKLIFAFLMMALIIFYFEAKKNDFYLTAEEYFLRATDNDSNYQYQIDNYSKCLIKNPNYPRAYFKRGNSYLKLFKYENAIDDFTSAIALDSNVVNHQAYFNRGISYYNIKKYEDAIADFTISIRMKTDFPDAYYYRGLSNYNIEKYDESFIDYAKTVRINPDYTEAYIETAVICRMNKRYFREIFNLTEAIRIETDSSKSRLDLNYLSRLYWNRGLAKENGDFPYYCVDYLRACQNKGDRDYCDQYEIKCN
jgi:tetratricopeptide (TPR) repeat protein